MIAIGSVISVTVCALLHFERAFASTVADAATVSSNNQVSAMLSCVSKFETVFTWHWIAYIIYQFI